MSHPLLRQFASRAEKHRLLTVEWKARQSGAWGPWEKITFPRGTVGQTDWVADITVAHRNRVFCVLAREAPNGVTHLAVNSLSQVRPTWHEMQRIKNELAGPERTAVEVYPPQARVVDAADMYHIWVLPGGLSFGLHEEEGA